MISFHHLAKLEFKFFKTGGLIPRGNSDLYSLWDDDWGWQSSIFAFYHYVQHGINFLTVFVYASLFLSFSLSCKYNILLQTCTIDPSLFTTLKHLISILLFANLAIPSFNSQWISIWQSRLIWKQNMMWLQSMMWQHCWQIMLCSHIAVFFIPYVGNIWYDSEARYENELFYLHSHDVIAKHDMTAKHDVSGEHNTRAKHDSSNTWHFSYWISKICILYFSFRRIVVHCLCGV